MGTNKVETGEEGGVQTSNISGPGNIIWKASYPKHQESH